MATDDDDDDEDDDDDDNENNGCGGDGDGEDDDDNDDDDDPLARAPSQARASVGQLNDMPRLAAQSPAAKVQGPCAVPGNGLADPGV